ncbi:MAG: hypothetical protein IJ600_04205 [Lachnospiraceae bacterium]|nr:hypothetical protein [Lachnospiraceae bacterium]
MPDRSAGRMIQGREAAGHDPVSVDSKVIRWYNQRNYSEGNCQNPKGSEQLLIGLYVTKAKIVVM